MRRPPTDSTLIYTEIILSLGQLFKVAPKSSKNKNVKSFNSKVSEKTTQKTKILHQKDLVWLTSRILFCSLYIPYFPRN